MLAALVPTASIWTSVVFTWTWNEPDAPARGASETPANRSDGPSFSALISGFESLTPAGVPGGDAREYTDGAFWALLT